MTIAELSRRATKPAHSVVSALGLALLIVGVEYLARHFALLWLPAIGALRVNDVGAGGQLAGLLATSVLFSLKHALIDASLGRTLALTGFGLVMGLLALRHGWRVRPSPTPSPTPYHGPGSANALFRGTFIGNEPWVSKTTSGSQTYSGPSLFR